MGVPTQRHTKSRRDKGRMHIFIEQSKLTLCPKCGKRVLPHTVCPNCGYYRDREEINVLAKLEKKERKKREKEIKTKEREEKKELKRTPTYPPSRERASKPLSWKELSRK